MQLYLAISALLSNKQLSAGAAVAEAHAIIAHAGEKGAPAPRRHAGDGVKTVPLVNYRGAKR